MSNNKVNDFPLPMTKCRVYIAAGYESNRPFTAINVWSDQGVSQARIEGYPAFNGWLTAELDVTQLVDNEVPPKRPNEFRVALVKGSRYEGELCAVIHSGDKNSPAPQGMRNFLGWLTETLTFELPKPERKALWRFRWESPRGPLEGVFVSTPREQRAALGRSVNFGKVFGMRKDLQVVLLSEHFEQITEDQTVIAGVTNRGRVTTVCGFNPLTYLS